MKIIRFTALPGAPGADLDFHPDSALLPQAARPFFHPACGEPWEARLCVAVHVNRLGKCVAPKFAPRYYDALALAVQFAPAAPDALQPGELSGLDDSIAHGPWLEAAVIFGADEAAVVLEPGGPACRVSLVAVTPGAVDMAVQAASRHTTLRMGDLLLLPLGCAAAISPRSRLGASIGSATALDIKIV